MKSDKTDRPPARAEELLKLRLPTEVYDIFCQVSNLTGRSIHNIALSALNVAARDYKRSLASRRQRIR